MASRHSVDLPYNPRRFSDLMPTNGDFSWQSGRSLLATPEDPSQSGFAVTSSEKSSAKSDRRRSFHEGELKREPGRKPKPSAPVSVVGLGCWAPSQSKGSMKAVKQHAHHQQILHTSLPEPLLELAGRDDPSSSYGYEHTGVGHVKSELQFTSGAVEDLGEKDSPDSNSPRVFVCPVPDSFANDAPQSKRIQHSTHHKSRNLQQKGVKDVQNAIHRLSSRLKRMDLDEVLVPGLDKACNKHAMPAAHPERLEEIDKEKSHHRCSFQGEAEDTHGLEFTERRTQRAHSRHGVHRRKRHNHPSEQKLSCCLEETTEHDERSSHGDGLIHIFSTKGDIRAPQYEKAAFIHRGAPELENPPDVGTIELVIISSPRKEVCNTDIPALGQVPNLANVDYPSQVLEGISQPDGHGSSFRDHVLINQDSNKANSLCFSELLLSSSDVCSPSSEDSSQLSEVLQNLSGSQAHRSVKSEEPLQGRQAKQTRDQSSQTLDMQERGGCCDEDALPILLSCIDNSSRFQTSSDRERALLWIHEQDKASQNSAIDVDPTLLLTRFGNLLLSSIPCEGMQMVALEPLFHETIKIARSFLRMLTSHLLELGKEFYTKELSEKQRDDEKSVIRTASLPNICFAHQNHIIYGVQAFINELIYDQFDKPSYCGDNRSAECWVLLVELQCLAPLASIDAINPYSDSYNKCFHRLCFNKLQLVQNKLTWLHEWPDHLLRAFLDAMKYVWQAHLIAQASLNAISIIRVSEWSSYDSSVMDVVDYDHNVAEFISKIQFMISPGFKLQGSVVKCEVYLMPKAA